MLSAIGDEKRVPGRSGRGQACEFAIASLDNPAARNAVIKLGGPEALSPLEVVKVFEKQSGRRASNPQLSAWQCNSGPLYLQRLLILFEKEMCMLAHATHGIASFAGKLDQLTI